MPYAVGSMRNQDPLIWCIAKIIAVERAGTAPQIMQVGNVGDVQRDRNLNREQALSLRYRKSLRWNFASWSTLAAAAAAVAINFGPLCDIGGRSGILHTVGMNLNS